MTMKTPRPPLPGSSLSVFIVESMFALLVNIFSTCGSEAVTEADDEMPMVCFEVHMEICALDVVRWRSLRLCHWSPIVFPMHKPL